MPLPKDWLLPRALQVLSFLFLSPSLCQTKTVVRLRHRQVGLEKKRAGLRAGRRWRPVTPGVAKTNPSVETIDSLMTQQFSSTT